MKLYRIIGVGRSDAYYGSEDFKRFLKEKGTILTEKEVRKFTKLDIPQAYAGSIGHHYFRDIRLREIKKVREFSKQLNRSL